ncbi:hypothetical protein [Nocardioides alcanivorans]|uniref:hypothetical protein n=1 Tax=Nocardioides alcanivorans TaxID=2897352 RepID=UPI001F34B9A3|nr:hypothetical protein [Nocardioides alcanivorans]
MSTISPRGPLPARVYWVRRGVVLGVVFLLVFTLTRIFSGGSDGDDKATARQASGKTSEQVQPTDDASTDEPKKKKKKQQKPVLAAPDGPCDPAEVSIGATLKSTPAGADVIEIPLELTTDRAACTFVVSQRTVALKITSGDDLIWSSQHCGKALGSHDVIVRRAEPAVVTIGWQEGRRSSEGCVLGGWAMPGGYHAISATFGGEPTDQYFELTAAKPEVITKTRKPKKTKKEKAAEKRAAEKKAKQKKKAQEQAEKKKRNQPSDDASTPTEERASGNGAQEP